jgi:hypothetical protein
MAEEAAPAATMGRVMTLLKRVLRWGAGLTVASGVGLALFPSPILHQIFEQNHISEYAWVRVAGLEGVGLGMLMVLVAHHIEELWWFSWAFVITSGSIAVYAALKAFFAVPADSSALLWWLIAGLEGVFTALLLIGLTMTGLEKPVP